MIMPKTKISSSGLISAGFLIKMGLYEVIGNMLESAQRGDHEKNLEIIGMVAPQTIAFMRSSARDVYHVFSKIERYTKQELAKRTALSFGWLRITEIEVKAMAGFTCSEKEQGDA